MKKKILFLDGDGTLWYPSKTKRTQKPHWVYQDETIKDNYLEHLELAPQVKETLETFYEQGMCLVVISANPKDEATAVSEILERINHFGLHELLHECRASPGDDPNGKAKIMLEVIQKRGLSRQDAVMVGDSYFYDYLPAKEAGIDAYFIDSPVARMPEVVPRDLQRIQEVSDLIDILKSADL